MSSPPLPSAPLADRFAWLAAEARAEKDDVGMIAAALIEVFARLIGLLAGFAARIDLGVPQQPEPRATTVTIAAPLSEDRPRFPPPVAGGAGGIRASKEGVHTRNKSAHDGKWVHRLRVRVPPSPLAAIAWVEGRLAAWRRLPASTAGPFFNREFP